MNSVLLPNIQSTFKFPNYPDKNLLDFCIPGSNQGCWILDTDFLFSPNTPARVSPKQGHSPKKPLYHCHIQGISYGFSIIIQFPVHTQISP